MSETFDADYFLRGVQTHKSLYEDYRWLPSLTIPMVQTIVAHCGIMESDSILDFGCARGYSVRALREIGHEAFGTDTSRWAIENADPAASPYLDLMPGGAGPPLFIRTFDWVIAKDVLEHIPYVMDTITALMNATAKGLFVVVPLSAFDGGTYVVGDYEKDRTHVQRATLLGWAEKFMRPGWAVTMTYRVPGIKDNYSEWAKGNGFLVVRRLR